MHLTQEWDKTFPREKQVTQEKVTFRTRFGFTLAADVYRPRTARGRHAALAVCGPFGAVKEQAAGLYAQELARRGFLTVAFDPSYTGESCGVGGVRGVASVDINTEDFAAAVDYLTLRDDVAAGGIGLLGLGGWGLLALRTAAQDTRVRAVALVSPCSLLCGQQRIEERKEAAMARHHSPAPRVVSEEVGESLPRRALFARLSAQRTEDARRGTCARAGGIPDPLPQDAPLLLRECFAYYKTQRGYHPRSLCSNDGWNVTGLLSLLTSDLLCGIDAIECPVLVLCGEKSPARKTATTVFQTLTTAEKKLHLVPDATHTDLYDKRQQIPFADIEAFFRRQLHW